MGTRADFYVGRGKKAQWLGSIAWDGYPHGLRKSEDEKIATILLTTTEQGFRNALCELFKGRDDVTVPADGWPWPWEDSRTTDYAYAFDGGKVWASCFGHCWYDPTQGDEPERNVGDPKTAVFPNMRGIQKTTFGSRSGLMIFTSKGTNP